MAVKHNKMGPQTSIKTAFINHDHISTQQNHSDDLVKMTVEISSDLHHRIKLSALNQRKKMREVITEAMNKYLSENP